MVYRKCTSSRTIVLFCLTACVFMITPNFIKMHQKLNYQNSLVLYKYKNNTTSKNLTHFNDFLVHKSKPTNADIVNTDELNTRTPSLEERLKSILGCYDRVLKMEKLQYGDYWLVRNFIRGTVSRNVSCSETLTYTTHGDYTFIDNLPMVITHWRAPLSFAIFAPGFDTNATLDSIQYARNCLPESDLIRKYVTFHLYFPREHMPSYVPYSEAEALSLPYECSVDSPPYLNVNRSVMYKTQMNLTYPINVGRNIARKAANTHFIFACDNELIPSKNLAQNFLQMIARNHSIYLSDNSLRVFALPIFELELKAHIPQTKTELKLMLDKKLAIPFHSKICMTCHLVPKQDQWLKATSTATGELTVFTVGKREGIFRYWEPFYISDNKEPMFDERISWEGQSNKRIQGYAMCLLNYEYQILHPAFLVHKPGIKHFNKKSPRLKYVPPTNYLIKHTIKPEYEILYGKNQKCGT